MKIESAINDLLDYKDDHDLEIRDEVIDIAIQALKEYHSLKEIKITHIPYKTTECYGITYLDKQRQIIFPRYVTVELAKSSGWQWEEVDD